MKSDIVKVEQEKTKQVVLTSGRDVALSLLSNPLMQLATFVAFVEVCQMIRPDGEHQLISENWGNTLETIAVTGKSIDMLVGSVTSAIPAISGIKALLGSG